MAAWLKQTPHNAERAKEKVVIREKELLVALYL